MSFDDFLSQLGNAAHSDLRDLLDLFAIANAEASGDQDEISDAKRRRRGKPEFTALARGLWHMVRQFSPSDYRNAGKVSNLLYSALKPKTHRRRAAASDAQPVDRPPIARGTVLVKTIPRKTKQGTFYHRYVYINFAVSGGGYDGTDVGTKCVYLRGSRGLAYALDVSNAEQRQKLTDRILDAYRNGIVDVLVDEFSPLAEFDPVAPQEYAKQMLESQAGRCWWCGASLNGKYHVDHRVPYSRGGSNELSNLCVTCPSCNCRKADKLPQEWIGRLL